TGVMPKSSSTEAKINAVAFLISSYLSSSLTSPRYSIRDSLFVIRDSLSISRPPKLRPKILRGSLSFSKVLIISSIERQGILSFETLVGIFFTAALAIGLLIIPEEHLLESLFGDIAKIGYLEILETALLGFLILFFIVFFFREFSKITFSSDLAWGEGLNVNRLNLAFLLLLALSVAMGIKIIGALLMGALIILPASAAKNAAGSLKGLTLLSIIFGLISVFVGLFLAGAFQLPPGPMVVMVSAAIFGLSLFVRKA
ncbi:MAG: ABC 3 transport family protein, partial [Candidatus Azambacteria bacterium GW2011_GWC1_46_13]